VISVQRAKKFVSDSPGLVDFVVRVSGFHPLLAQGASESFQGKYLRKLNYRSTVKTKAIFQTDLLLRNLHENIGIALHFINFFA